MSNKIDRQKQMKGLSMKHLENLSQTLNDLRKQNKFCDIIVNVGGRAFGAHKVVLIACSSYFMTMFSSGFKEGTDREISIEGKAEIFEILLEYAYTGMLTCTSETAYDILDMACYMQFKDACCDCSTQIIKDIAKYSVMDVLKISELAKRHDHLQMTPVSEAAVEYLVDHLPELKKSEMFLQNSTEAFLQWFLMEDCVPGTKHGEKDVLETVISWLKHDWENRRSFAYPLLQQVRLGLVPGEELQKLMATEIWQIQECRELVEKVVRDQTSGRPITHLGREMPHIFATRSTITAPIIIAAPGNIYSVFARDINKWERDQWKTTDDCSMLFNYGKKYAWEELSSCDPIRRLPSLIEVHGQLYAVGGIEDEWDSSESDPSSGTYNEQYKQSFSVYNAERNKWQRLPSMTCPRHKILLVYLSDNLYAIAGEDGDDDDEVERYNFTQKKWDTLAYLPGPFDWVSAVAFKGKILVYGESWQSVQDNTSTIAVYNAGNNTWEIKLSVEHPCDLKKSRFGSYVPKPLLFVHKDKCYRALYQLPSGTDHILCTVNKVLHDSVEDGFNFSIGEEVSQDHIPANELGAFRIGDEVYLNLHGFVHKTDLQITDDQDVNLEPWKKWSKIFKGRCSNMTYFTFDYLRVI